MVKGRTMTSYPSLKTDLRNAGAVWVDKELVEDRNIISSRGPQDLPIFNRRIVAKFAEARTLEAGASTT